MTTRFRDSGRARVKVSGALDSDEAVMLVGPTGCGKTTLVQDLAAERAQALETIVGHGDLTPNDLLGRWYIEREGSVWRDGPLTRAVKAGSLFYFDEVGGVPEDVLRVLYPLLDHRRQLLIPGLATSTRAHPDFRFVGAYNPGYLGGRGLSPAFRQRCRFVHVPFLARKDEARLLCDLTGVSATEAERLVAIAELTRSGEVRKLLPEGVGTRLLIIAARMLVRGASVSEAILEGLIYPLTDEPHRQKAIMDGLASAGLAPEPEIAEPISVLATEESDAVSAFTQS